MKPKIRSWSLLVAVLAAGSSIAEVAPTFASDTERKDSAEKSLNEMRAALKGVLKLLEEARDDKDLLKLSCVNEKLTQVKGLLKVSEQAEVELGEAVARKEKDIAEHNSIKISIARERIEQLRLEAEQCIGQLAYVIDEKTIVEVVSPEGLPTDDPTVVSPPAPPVTRPPPASPEKP